MEPKDNQPATKAEVDEWAKNMRELLGPVEPMSTAQEVAHDLALAEEFYDEDARGTVTNYWILLRDWQNATQATYGEQSTEYAELKTQTDAVREKLKQIEQNLHDPKVKAAMQPLRELWGEYRGWQPNDKGGLEQRKKPLGPEVLSAFWRTTSFDL